MGCGREAGEHRMPKYTGVNMGSVSVNILLSEVFHKEECKQQSYNRVVSLTEKDAQGLISQTYLNSSALLFGLFLWSI